MGKMLKWIGILIVLLVVVSGIRQVILKSKDAMVSPDGKYDVVDGMIGVVGIDKLNEIKEKRDTFNLPALKTSFMMFQSQNGRLPRDLTELENSGDANSSLTRDHFGNLYQMKIVNNRTVILHGAGKDKIQGTTDDVDYTLNF